TREPAPLFPAALQLEARLRDAGAAMLGPGDLAGAEAELRALRDAGRAVRVSGRLHAHADVAGQVRERVVALIERDGRTTLAALRDDLGASRKVAQAFLEHLDAERVTRRLPDDARVLRRTRG
ncbi:MAG TPA: SelB C-terminal domain-containing protein, partial [Baekduia sp.]|nr:SelB C-terminal domain-containing protein [Baekduia sp.]